MTEWFTRGEAAKMIGCHKSTLHRMMKRGELKRIGVVPRKLKHGTKEWQFSREQIETIKKYREEREQPADKAANAVVKPGSAP